MAAVTLIDYGLGNIQAFAHIYKRLNISVEIASCAEQLQKVNRLILPGVGSFDWAMSRINNSGMRESIDDLVLNKSIPVLGVCVGMQMMAKASSEGKAPGLGWVDANVISLTIDREKPLPLPHMGWNDVMPDSNDCLFRGLSDPRFYFLHSYCIVPEHPCDSLATTSYGGTFTAAIRRKNVFGTQFHPEKSHDWGIGLLRNFAEI